MISEIIFLDLKKKQNTDQPTVDQISKDEIITLINKARYDLAKDIISLGVDCKNLDFHCQIQPSHFEKDFHYEQISDDDDDSTDDKASDYVDVRDAFDDADQIDEEDRHILSGVTGKVEFRDYSETGMTVDENDSMVIVWTGSGTGKKVRKSAIAWYLNKNRSNLSSDRMRRVRATDDISKDKGTYQTSKIHRRL